MLETTPPNLLPERIDLFLLLPTPPPPLLRQAEEIVELCDNAEKLFAQEKSVLQLSVGGGKGFGM
jgi:hypothetical protein